MNTKINAKYFFFGLLLAVFALTLVLLHPFLPLLVLGASIAVVLYPLYNWFNGQLPWQKGWLSSILTVLIFIIILCVPLFFIGKSVVRQSTEVYNTLVTEGESDAYAARFNKTIAKYLPEDFDFRIEEKAADIFATISKNVAGIFTKTLTVVLYFLLLLLAIFYFLKDGHRWRRVLIFLSPLPNTDDVKVLGKLQNAVNGVVKGYLLIAALQGLLMGVGLTIFGVPHAALFGLFAAVASLVPSIGTAIVAIPVILFLFASGDTTAAIGFTIWSTIIVGFVDNLLNPVLVGRKTNIPPLFVLFSVLGGIALLGPVGILIGPLTISLLLALISIYREREMD